MGTKAALITSFPRKREPRSSRKDLAPGSPLARGMTWNVRRMSHAQRDLVLDIQEIILGATCHFLFFSNSCPLRPPPRDLPTPLRPPRARPQAHRLRDASTLIIRRSTPARAPTHFVLRPGVGVAGAWPGHDRMPVTRTDGWSYFTAWIACVMVASASALPAQPRTFTHLSGSSSL